MSLVAVFPILSLKLRTSPKLLFTADNLCSISKYLLDNRRGDIMQNALHSSTIQHTNKRYIKLWTSTGTYIHVYLTNTSYIKRFLKI
jgi:hypothetical protein